jgi:hypothetical protein
MAGTPPAQDDPDDRHVYDGALTVEMQAGIGIKEMQVTSHHITSHHIT